MRTRVLVGTTLAIVLIGLLVLDGYLATSAELHPSGVAHWLRNGALCTAVIVVLTALATHELVGLARARGYHPFGRTAQVFAVVLAAGPYISFNLSPLTGGYDESWGMLWLAVALAFCFLLQALLHGTKNAMENLATTVFVMFYAGGLAGFMTKLRMEVGGAVGVTALLFSVFLVKMTDTGAYFVGTLLGRHKMVPWLSPKKTWEGFAGGLAVTILCALGVGHALHSAELLVVRPRVLSVTGVLLLLGIVLGLFSVAGDLCASLLKRDAAVKDSGRGLPGMGGVLDIVDSPLLAAPVAWFFWARLFPLASG